MHKILLIVFGVISLTAGSWGQTHPLDTVGATASFTNLGAFSGNYVVVESRDSYAPGPYQPDPSNFVDWGRGYTPDGSKMVTLRDPNNAYREIKVIASPNGETRVYDASVSQPVHSYFNPSLGQVIEINPVTDTPPEGAFKIGERVDSLHSIRLNKDGSVFFETYGDYQHITTMGDGLLWGTFNWAGNWTGGGMGPAYSSGGNGSLANSPQVSRITEGLILDGGDFFPVDRSVQ